jgi:hypothetical protein
VSCRQQRKANAILRRRARVPPLTTQQSIRGLQAEVFRQRSSGSVFGETIAKICGNALLNDTPDEARKRGRDGNQNPEQRGEDKTGNCDSLKRDGDGMCLIQMNPHSIDVGDKLNPVNDDGRQQESHNGERADADQEDIDGAGKTLAATAMGAVGQVLIVVRAHGGRETRDVVAPTGEDIPHHLIDAASGVGSAVHWKC